jgi:hypothetical protein
MVDNPKPACNRLHPGCACDGRDMTARQIIERRLARKLPPAKDMPRDIRRAVMLLGFELAKRRKQEAI